MTEETPQAAGYSGQTNPALSSGELPRTDDELRRYAAEQLSEHLAIGVNLAARCQGLSIQAHDDKVGPINAAARLMQANARVAEALARMAYVERRSRSISERIQGPDRKQVELNLELENEKRLRENVTEFWQRLHNLTESNKRERGEEGGGGEIAARLAKEKAKLAYAERRLAGEEDPSYVFHDGDDEEDESDV